MALPLAQAMPGLSQNPLLQNAAPSSGNLQPFMDFLNARKKNAVPKVPTPEQQMGTPQNASMFGGNLISPAFQALMGNQS